MKRKTNRLVNLDILRVFAIAMMVLGHSFFDLASPNYYRITDFPWNFWDFIRGLTAPIFLIISGMVQVFANTRIDGKLAPDVKIRRIYTALLLIFIGYFLQFPVKKIFHIFVLDYTHLTPFFQINILQLIGVTLLWLVLYYILTPNNVALGKLSLVTSILIFAFTPIVHIIDWYKILPLPLAAYLSLTKGSYFTIFPFSGFLFFGVAFGTYIERFPVEERMRQIFHSGFKLSFILLPIGILLYIGINLLNLPLYDLFKGNTGMSIIRISIVFALLSSVTYFYQKFSTNLEFLTNFSKILGKNSLFVYVVHLLLLYGSPLFFGVATFYHKQLGLLEAFGISSLILIFSLALTYFFEKIATQEKLVKPIIKYGLVSSAILLIFV
ncbi:MAG: DUF1624 domain-containing protein [Ignavibacteria bacterium]|nr:DUF1624 domain-containing protein [Ignavibacteria bacterium]